VSLGWSVSHARGSFPGRQTHRRQQVSSGRMRRGTSSACAKRTHSSRRRLISASTNEDTSFAQSRDPCTSIVTELPRRKSREVMRRSRYRGRASPRKWEQTGTGVLIDGRLRGSPRLTASRGNSRRSCVSRKNRKVVMAIVPARKRESRTKCPYVVFQVAEVGRQHPGLE